MSLLLEKQKEETNTLLELRTINSFQLAPSFHFILLLFLQQIHSLF